jgi:hypothetical protein
MELNLKIICNEDKNYNLLINNKTFQKMKFFFNAIENGWTIKKDLNDNYVFSKKHENKREIFDDSYLSQFIAENLELPL